MCMFTLKLLGLSIRFKKYVYHFGAVEYVWGGLTSLVAVARWPSVIRLTRCPCCSLTVPGSQSAVSCSDSPVPGLNRPGCWNSLSYMPWSFKLSHGFFSCFTQPENLLTLLIPNVVKCSCQMTLDLIFFKVSNFKLWTSHIYLTFHPIFCIHQDIHINTYNWNYSVSSEYTKCFHILISFISLSRMF